MNEELNQNTSEDIFKFVPASSGKWSFIFEDSDYRGIDVRKRNEDGSYTFVETSGTACELEEEQRIIWCFMCSYMISLRL